MGSDTTRSFGRLALAYELLISEEHDPRREVVGKVLEAVFHAGRDEEEVAGGKGGASLAAKERALA